ncbi:MAG: ABC transporter substrate-binding protein [Patescibacteria group bacterium]
MSKLVTWALVAAVVFVGGLAIFSQSGTGARTVRIGVILPMTGDASSYGTSEYRALQVAADAINSTGGIDGKAVEFVLEDGKCDPQTAGSAAQKLVSIDKVKIIIGGACSGETLAAAAVTEPAKILLISPSASSPKITNAGDFVFRTYPSDVLAGKIAAVYAWGELDSRKAALMTEQTDYADGLRGIFRAAFEANGGTVVADETYETGSSDVSIQIEQIKKAKPDIIYFVPQTVNSGIALITSFKDAGIKTKLLTAEILLDRQAVAEHAEILEGVIGVEAAVDWEGNVEAKKLQEAHRAMFNGADPGLFAAHAYDAMRLIDEALSATGIDPIDTEKVRDWLSGVEDWYGAGGSITIDTNGDPVMGEGIRRIKDGSVVNLGTYIP